MRNWDAKLKGKTEAKGDGFLNAEFGIRNCFFIRNSQFAIRN